MSWDGRSARWGEWPVGGDQSTFRRFALLGQPSVRMVAELGLTGGSLEGRLVLRILVQPILDQEQIPSQREAQERGEDGGEVDDPAGRLEGAAVELRSSRVVAK